jgi:UDP-4-amino-4,6-dideoxy-N-acetyl-beta-L-altrosamine N-acetyltransferase
MDDVRLREMTHEDLTMVLKWRNHPDVRKNMYTQHEISLEEHTSWFANLDKEDSKYYICEVNNEPIGSINFTNLKKAPFQVMWGFYSGDLTRAWRWKDYGSNGLRTCV